MGVFDLDRALKRGLTYVERGELPFSTPLLRRAIETRAIVGGSLSDGLDGLVAEVLLAPDHTRDDESRESLLARARHAGVVLTQVPESVPFMPLMACRDDRRQGFADRLIGPGGIIPLYKEVQFESIDFNQRYRVGMGRHSDLNWLYQLFSPSFIDWLAERAPHGCYFELMGGVLCVTSEEPPSTEEGFDALCEFSGRVAERLRSESLEREALPLARTALPPIDRRRNRVGAVGWAIALLLPLVVIAVPALFAFAFLASQGAPAGIAAAIVGVPSIVFWIWFSIKLMSAQRRSRREARSFDAVLRHYASERGMELADGRSFSLEHLRLRTPGAVSAMAAGELPGGRPGELVMIGQPGGSLVFGGYVPLAQERDRPALRISPRAASEGTLILAGFPVLEAKGVHVPATGREEDALASEPVRDRYSVVLDEGDAGSARQAIDRLEPWLLDPVRAGRVAVSLEREGALVLTDIAPTGEWSAERLDRVGSQAVEAAALLE